MPVSCFSILYSFPILASATLKAKPIAPCATPVLQEDGVIGVLPLGGGGAFVRPVLATLKKCIASHNLQPACKKRSASDLQSDTDPLSIIQYSYCCFLRALQMIFSRLSFRSSFSGVSGSSLLAGALSPLSPNRGKAAINSIAPSLLL